MLADDCTRLVASTMLGKSVAIAKHLVQVLRDRNRPTVVQNHRGLAGVGVSVSRVGGPRRRWTISIEPAEREHLANPVAKLRRPDGDRFRMVQDVPDIVEHGLCDKCFGSLHV